ncbi:Acg family FMN-binding oxidoreductase [Hoeflea poritis]|uniref:Twin-arginine translocation pathway signal protein n=1 Tax=Hoeflea poritis TaxID=2993659 RepID=A0ABT4VTJ4_9HYPH|nr:twin-arginine translocation pathway signal protein [Hoeflea poritis]MDA4848027.1 twin-arginine translocation pathway signal protein [Hoeflea poritis]
MSISRRKALAIVGGGTIVAATAASGLFAATRRPERALAPWSGAGEPMEPRRNALSYAILAPNPHNRQPWLVELEGSNTIILHRDTERDLPETDPHARQLTIGLGCFLELMTIAAAQTGHAVDLDVFPDGESGPVAVARFRDGASPDPLFAHVLERRSCKEPYSDRAVPNEMITQLGPLADIRTDPQEVAAIRELTWQAFRVEIFTPRTMQESVDLMRFGKSEINANPDGIDLGGPFLEALMLAGMLSREAQSDPNSTGFKEGVRMYQEMLHATPAYAVLTTPGNARSDQIEAGRRWLRLNLTTTALGLSLHPVSQALQEFAEMKPHYDEAHRLLAEAGHTVQMLGRLGFGPTVPPSPRWPLETRIIDG